MPCTAKHVMAFGPRSSAGEPRQLAGLPRQGDSHIGFSRALFCLALSNQPWKVDPGAAHGGPGCYHPDWVPRSRHLQRHRQAQHPEPQSQTRQR